MQQRISVVDAFTDTPFHGNPAAVCVLSEQKPDEWMQQLAMEMNLPETAFLRRLENGNYTLRWFTPTTEVDLCGHATLAAAHILWEEGLHPASEPIEFDTKSGALFATRDGDWIVLDFPTEAAELCEAPVGLLQALHHAKTRFVGRNRLDYLVELEDESLVHSLAPDMNVLLRIEARGLIVTAVAKDATFDFVSRYFAPRIGVNEDPVTGSTHTALAPYWAAKLGKTSLMAFQASRRGGVLKVEARAERVGIAGQAVTVLRAHLV